MDVERIINDIRTRVKDLMGNDFSHGYPHVLRVLKYANIIIRGERLVVDKILLEISILLHDVGRIIGEPHAYYSAIIARGLLEEYGFQREFIDKVVNAILSHSYSYRHRYGVEPETVEAKILSDADKLDALGVIGFARVAAFSVYHNRGLKEMIKHIDEKLLNLDKLLYFETSRRIASRKKKILYNIRILLEEELKDLGIV